MKLGMEIKLNSLFRLENGFEVYKNL